MAEKPKFFQFRRKKDEKNLARIKEQGGTYKTKSRKARNPRDEDKTLKRGSQVTVTKRPGSIKLGKTEASSGLKMQRTEKVVFDAGDRQKDATARKGAVVNTRPTTAENAKQMGENPAKAAMRLDTQNKAKAQLADGKKVKLGPVAYDYKGKKEYAGEYRKEVTDTPKLETRTKLPKMTVKDPSKTITVKAPDSGTQMRKLPRVPWLKNKGAKGLTKGERRRKKTESGHGN